MEIEHILLSRRHPCDTQLKETEEITAYTNAMDRFCKLAKRVCGAKVTAGIGAICDGIAELPASYQGARNAVSYRVFMEIQEPLILRRSIRRAVQRNRGKSSQSGIF